MAQCSWQFRAIGSGNSAGSSTDADSFYVTCSSSLLRCTTNAQPEACQLNTSAVTCGVAASCRHGMETIENLHAFYLWGAVSRAAAGSAGPRRCSKAPTAPSLARSSASQGPLQMCCTAASYSGLSQRSDSSVSATLRAGCGHRADMHLKGK